MSRLMHLTIHAPQAVNTQLPWGSWSLSVQSILPTDIDWRVLLQLSVATGTTSLVRTPLRAEVGRAGLQDDSNSSG